MRHRTGSSAASAPREAAAGLPAEAAQVLVLSPGPGPPPPWSGLPSPAQLAWLLRKQVSETACDDSVHELTNLNHRVLGKLPWCKSVHPATRSPLVRHNPAPSCDCLNRANPNSSCKPQQLRHFGVETLRSWETSRQTNKSPQFQ